MKSLAMKHDVDPATEILDRVREWLPRIALVSPYEVLVGIYQRPTSTKSGIILTDKARDEDIWQGKVGLVLSVGERAFTEDESHRWPERTPRVGDWVAYRVGDSWPLLIGEQHCRVIEDRHFRLILDHPDMVY
jgi:co-chaperonin GroES (HSP10)